MSLIEIKYNSLRRLEGTSAEITGVRRYSLIVHARDIPKQLQEWTSLIPKVVKVVGGESVVFNGIQRTLAEDPKELSDRNKGLTILAKKVFNEQSTSTLSLELDSPESCGLIDGKTTLAAILDYMQGLDEMARKQLTAEVKVEVLTGVKEEKIEDLVLAHNISVAYTGAIVDDEITKPIKQVLDADGLSEIVAYRYEELGEKPIDIRSIISYLPLLNPLKFEAGELVFTYTARHKAIKEYQKFLKATEGQPDLERQFNSQLLLLPSLLKVRDRIYQDLPKVWDESSGAKYEKLPIVRLLTLSPLFGSYRQPLNEEMEFVSDSFIYPLLATFRNNLELDENGRYRWQVEPMQLWEETKADLVGRLKEFVKNDTRLQQVGKTVSVWSALSDVMELKLLKRK